MIPPQPVWPHVTAVEAGNLVDSPGSKLPFRYREVLALVAEGLTRDEVLDVLGIQDSGYIDRAHYAAVVLMTGGEYEA